MFKAELGHFSMAVLSPALTENKTQKRGYLLLFVWPLVSPGCLRFCTDGTWAGFRKDMIQTVPDPAAHIKVGPISAGKLPWLRLGWCSAGACPPITEHWGQEPTAMGHPSPPKEQRKCVSCFPFLFFFCGGGGLQFLSECLRHVYSVIPTLL